MTSRDIDTVLSVLLAADFTTLPASSAMLRGRAVEVPWLLDVGLDTIRITISGRVDGDEVWGLYAEDEHGTPVRIPDAFVPDALADLIIADREIWGPS